MADKEFGPHSYIQVPPDSTGKVLGALATHTVAYNTGTNDFSVGDLVIGQTSGARGYVIEVVAGSVTANGQIVVQLEGANTVEGFTEAENILVGEVVFAKVASEQRVYTQRMVLAGGSNPLNAQYVDPLGAAYVRFSEGAQQLDAYGLTRTSHPTLIASYSHRYGIQYDDFQIELAGAGTVTHLPNQSALAADVGTSAGDKVTISTHRYHQVQPGFGLLVMSTGYTGDTGKPGLRRRYGYFDAYDGVYIETVDTATSYIVMRSSTTGSVVETRVPQSAWNGDRVDGSGGAHNLSGVQLNTMYANLSWIDFQWLGAGRIRIGTYNPTTGERIINHVIQGGNIQSAPFWRQPNLPVRQEIENYAETAGPSRSVNISTIVCVEGDVIPMRQQTTKKYAVPSELVTVSGASSVRHHVLSLRATTTVSGITNRKVSTPELLAVSVEDGPVHLALGKSWAIDGASYSSVGNQAVETTTAGTITDGDAPIVSWVLAPGQHNLEFPPNFGVYSESLITTSSGLPLTTYTLCASTLGSSETTAKVQAFLTIIDS